MIHNATIDGPSSSTRGHKIKFQKEHFSSKSRNDFASSVTNRENFLTNRTISLWNNLPYEVVAKSKSPNSFKAQLDKHMPSIVANINKNKNNLKYIVNKFFFK